MRYLSLTAGALLFFVGCSPKAETSGDADLRIARESSAAKMVIDSLNAEFDAAFNAGRGDDVASQYTDDGSLAVPNAPAMQGRVALAEGVNGLASMKAAIRTKAVSVMANGPLAIEHGEYTLSIVPPGAPTALTESGTYLIHWHKVGDHWLRAADVATSPAPIPAPGT